MSASETNISLLSYRKLPRTLILAGGVGGARLAQGFYNLYYKVALSESDIHLTPDPHEQTPAYSSALPLHIVINTGDDLKWMGLKVCPDLDTNLYTLAELNNEKQGWGLKGDTWSALNMLKRWPDNPTWFNVGDADLALSLQRTYWLGQGLNLAQVSCRLCLGLGLRPCLWPMSLEEVSTYVNTPQGALPFQEYFVKGKAQATALSFTYRGLAAAQPLPGLLELISEAELIVLAPSNPFVSLLPILSLPGVKKSVQKSQASKIAISPLVGNRAFKGPLSAMLQAAGLPISALGLAKLYSGLVEKFFLDPQDHHLQEPLLDMHISTVLANLELSSTAQRLALAASILKEVPSHVR